MWEYEEQEVAVHQLKLGMYVCRLDIPWSSTDYPLQGVLIQSEEDIDRLSAYCAHVYVDVAKFRAINVPIQQKSLTPPRAQRAKQLAGIKNTKKRDQGHWKARHCVEKYKTLTTLKTEIHQSTEIFDTVERQVYLLCEQTLRCRRASLEQMIDNTSQIVESIIRNPDAFAWLCRIRDTRKPIYMHVIRLAVLGGIVGRQLGLNRFALSHLCFTLLMTGIGKSRLSDSTLQSFRPGKVPKNYQKHLTETLYQLEQIRFYDQTIVETLADYCERFDGSGYPQGKKGSDIPFFSQICGLTETFELLVNPYDVSRAVSSANAIVYLNRCKGVIFETSLVEEFIRAMGLYPTGTLVQLNTGSLGVICEQNYDKRLRATVIPIVDRHGNILEKLSLMDLSYSESGSMGADSAFIRRGLPSNSIPRGLLERAHLWMYERSSTGPKGVKGFFQRLL